MTQRRRKRGRRRVGRSYRAKPQDLRDRDDGLSGPVRISHVCSSCEERVDHVHVLAAEAPDGGVVMEPPLCDVCYLGVLEAVREIAEGVPHVLGDALPSGCALRGYAFQVGRESGS